MPNSSFTKVMRKFLHNALRNCHYDCICTPDTRALTGLILHKGRGSVLRIHMPKSYCIAQKLSFIKKQCRAGKTASFELTGKDECSDFYPDSMNRRAQKFREGRGIRLLSRKQTRVCINFNQSSN